MKNSIVDRNCLSLILCLAVVLAAVPSFATPTVQLSPSLPSPQVVGTLITWTATASDPDPGILMYAFRVVGPGQGLTLVRDFGYGNSFPSTPAMQEGNFQVQVTVRNNSTGNTATTTQPFAATAIANTATPVVISPTTNALVALFSGIGCTAPNRMLVAFKNATQTSRQLTPSLACNGKSMNFYVAGLLANTQYSMTGVFLLDGKDVGHTQTKKFTTGSIPSTVSIPTISVISPAPAAAASQPILVHAYFFGNSVPAGTDLNGNVVWYYAAYDGLHGLMTRPEKGGYFWFIGNNSNDPYLQPIRKIDVAGNTVVETNTGRINEQLAAAGEMALTGMDHELRALPNGKILMLGSLDRILGPSIQNGADVLFNELVVLGSDLQLAWSWNAVTCGNCATQLPPTREAILHETCAPGQGGCPPLTPPNTLANDWLHGNAAELATDGSIVMSLRHQDWVLKIDYNNGAGTGNILWRLGDQGDFSIIGDAGDTYPWFSHQHDAQWEFGSSYMSVFDNGNTRIAQNPAQNSRGQLLKIDQGGMTATLVKNLDLGAQSFALGTAQALIDSKGHVTGLHYEAGFVNGTSQSISFYPSGTLNMASSSTTYRSFQMHDMYSPYTQP